MLPQCVVKSNGVFIEIMYENLIDHARKSDWVFIKIIYENLMECSLRSCMEWFDIAQNCMDQVRKWSVKNIDEYQLGILSLSLLFSMILQVIFFRNILDRFGYSKKALCKLNFVRNIYLFTDCIFSLFIGTRSNHYDCAVIPAMLWL